MTEGFSLKDYIKFFKKHINTVLITTGIILGAYVLWATMNYVTSDSPSDREFDAEDVQFDKVMIEELLETDFRILTDQEKAILVEYLENEAYYFNFYIENGDYTSFVNNEVLKKILTTEDVLNQVEEISGEQLLPNPHLGVVISREYGDILSLRIGTGDENVNQKISQAYFDVLTNDEIDFFDNKDLYFISDQPLSVDDITIDEENSDLNDETSTSFVNSIGTTIVMGIVVIIGGLLVGIVIAVLSRVFTKEISYLYDYVLDSDDKLIKLNESKLNENNTKELSLILSNDKNEVVLSENNELLADFEKHFMGSSTNNLKFYSDVTNVKNTNELSRYILLTEVDSTTKEWVKRQRILIKNLNKPMTIIQFS